MTEPLPLPIPASVGGGAAFICDADTDTCVLVEKTPDDDLVRLQAKSVESVTVSFEEVSINVGFKEKVDTIVSSGTLLANQKVIKIDATSGNIDIELPPSISNEGKRYSFVRIDTDLINIVNIKPTLGDKLQSVVDDFITLSSGDNVNIQCVGGLEGWFISM